MLYLLSRSHLSSPVESRALRITISYSPTTNWASILTPSLAEPFGDGAVGGGGTAPAPSASSIGSQHGSCSQYSTSRGADSASMCSNTSCGKVLTSSLCNTT